MKALKSIGLCALAFVVYYGAQLLLSFYAGIIAAFLPNPEGFLMDNLMLLTLLSGLVALVFFLLFPVARRKPIGESFDIRKPSLHAIPLLVFLGITASLAVSVLLSLIPFPEWAWEVYRESVGEPLSQTDFVTVASVVLMAPILEEILFRGILMKQLSRFMPSVLALFLSAALFGLAHWNLIQSTYAFLCGALMGFIYLRYRSIASSMLFHFGFNITSILLLLLIPEAYQELLSELLSIAAVPIFALLLCLMIFDSKQKQDPAKSFFYGSFEPPTHFRF